MNDAKFDELAEQLFTAIEDAIDGSAWPLDYESSASVLTIDCEDTDTKVIVSRQVAMHQIWVAAKSGGFHLDWLSDDWVCSTTKEPIAALLSRVCSEQSQEPIYFSLG